MRKILIGLSVGIVLGYALQIPANEKICAVLLLAAINSICGGFAAKLNLNFSDAILIGGFVTNAAFGLILVWLGNLFGLELYYIALFSFGLRIFRNLSVLKKFLLKNYGI